MKRRELKFVAGSLQLAPDRIATASRVSARAAASNKRRAATRKPTIPSERARRRNCWVKQHRVDSRRPTSSATSEAFTRPSA